MPPGVHTTLPPLSRMEQAGRPPADNLSSMRHQHTDGGHPRHYDKQPGVLSGSIAGKRPFPPSTETSADSSDEEEDGGELPASGLVAPWEVLRGLADVAIQRAAKVLKPIQACITYFTHTQYFAGEWRSKRTPKSYKIALPRSQIAPALQEAEADASRPPVPGRYANYLDTLWVLANLNIQVVSKGIITEAEATDLFKM
jgi:hypothetical protein